MPLINCVLLQFERFIRSLQEHRNAALIKNYRQPHKGVYLLTPSAKWKQMKNALRISFLSGSYFLRPHNVSTLMPAILHVSELIQSNSGLNNLVKTLINGRCGCLASCKFRVHISPPRPATLNKVFVVFSLFLLANSGTILKLATTTASPIHCSVTILSFGAV